MDTDLGWWGIPLAMLAGAIRTSTPFLLVSLGECITEKSGRVNLGLEGILVMGAMSAYAVAYLTGSPWLGVLAAAAIGALFGTVHGLVCSLPRVNHIAVGIALMIFGTGLAFYLGKPYIQPAAPRLPALELGNWSDIPQLRAALTVNSLFLIGVVLAPLLAWSFARSRWGLILRTVGDSREAAEAAGISVNRVRTLATMAGGLLAGVGGSFLSLVYPGSWNEGLSSGQGLIAVALVIFARWQPINCLYAALLFGAAGALGPALQSVGVSSGYYLLNAAPYVLTLVVLVVASSPRRLLAGAPGDLRIH